GLAHAWLTDQHWIVLGPPAENLDNSFEFSVAADQGIELAVHRRLSQIARKLAQQGRLALPLRLRLFLTGARQFFTDCGKPQPTFMQNLRGKTLLLPQQTQQ